MGRQCESEIGNPGDLEFQRKIYSSGFYRRLKTVRWLVRYDCHYRLFLMEETFRRHQIPFERQRVYELGFGTGNLLMRFDTSCCLHGCEVSSEAIWPMSYDGSNVSPVSTAANPESSCPQPP